MWSSTDFGAVSVASDYGGGYMASTAGASIAKKASTQGSNVPCTCAEILASSQEGDRFISPLGLEFSQVTVLGVIRSVVESATRVEYEVDDYTGSYLPVKMFVEDQDNAQGGQQSRPFRELSYVRVHGHVRNFQGSKHVIAFRIEDPYRWLEDPDSEETVAFVKAQNAITTEYLNRCSHTDKVKKRLKEIWNYERYSCPFQFGPYYYYWKNSGLQNQSVLYQLDSLSGTPSVFLDPNAIDADGLAAVRAYSFSEEGKYFCYGLSHSGSDWSELKFKVTETGDDLRDLLKRVKFSCIEWTHDEKGVFYCMYPEHEGKADGTETQANKNQKLMYHLLGSEQSEDVLCVERPDQPAWIIGAEVSVCGRYLLITYHDGCEPNNLFYYCDLAAVDYKITGKLDLIPIVDQFEAVYEYITNDGPVLTIRTNLNAPMYKLINIDLSNPDRVSLYAS
ncbi:hypothetical protein EG68_10664 [Paragonimus skrjabini miyazakii]|uniref:Peptidase S9A N-terminal domain-containing protein n=1 Tax=Paragonimus skrjabini miyazakii TaxID=59628 RepID=A0A8S9YG95_9TREM|nr:hypothetical protein EG68_10664 [Paragonimus skrjabini miyazakii]